MTLFGQEHVERYQATDGEEGYDWREGTKILLLTTTGRLPTTRPLRTREVMPTVAPDWESVRPPMSSRGER